MQDNIPAIYVVLGIAAFAVIYFLAGHVNLRWHANDGAPGAPPPRNPEPIAETKPHPDKERHPPEPPTLQTVTAECRTAEAHLRKAIDAAEACGIKADDLKALADEIESVKVALLHDALAGASKHDWAANRRRHAEEAELGGPVQLVAPVDVKVTSDKAA